MATISLKLESRKQSMRKDGTYPVKLFVEHKGKHPAIHMSIYAKPQHWSGSKLTKSWGKDYRTQNGKLRRAKLLAEQALDGFASKIPGWDHLQLRDFLKEYIERERIEQAKHSDIAPESSLKVLATMEKVRDWYLTLTPEADLENKKMPKNLIRKKKSFSCSEKAKTLIKSLRKGNYGEFSEDLRTTELTPEFLQQLYENMVAYGHAPLTIETHMNQLAACISYGLMLYSHETGHQMDWTTNYGFGKERRGKFELPKRGRSKKRAIKQDDLYKIFTTPVDVSTKEGRVLQQRRLFAVVMYNLNGMDFVDLAHMTPKNIEGYRDAKGVLHIQGAQYTRVKTDTRTRKTELVEIHCAVNKTVAKILGHFLGDRELDSTEYLFPILHQGTAGTRKAWLRNGYMRRKLNEALKQLAALAGFESAKVTCKVLRHNFATSLKLEQVNIYVAKEMLGHGTVQQTEWYMADCEIDQLEQAASLVNIEIEVNFDEPTETPLRKAS